MIVLLLSVIFSSSIHHVICEWNLGGGNNKFNLMGDMSPPMKGPMPMMMMMKPSEMQDKVNSAMSSVAELGDGAMGKMEDAMKAMSGGDDSEKAMSDPGPEMDPGSDSESEPSTTPEPTTTAESRESPDPPPDDEDMSSAPEGPKGGNDDDEKESKMMKKMMKMMKNGGKSDDDEEEEKEAKKMKKMMKMMKKGEDEDDEEEKEEKKMKKMMEMMKKGGDEDEEEEKEAKMMKKMMKMMKGEDEDDEEEKEAKKMKKMMKMINKKKSMQKKMMMNDEYDDQEEDGMMNSRGGMIKRYGNRGRPVRKYVDEYDYMGNYNGPMNGGGWGNNYYNKPAGWEDNFNRGGYSNGYNQRPMQPAPNAYSYGSGYGDTYDRPPMRNNYPTNSWNNQRESEWSNNGRGDVGRSMDYPKPMYSERPNGYMSDDGSNRPMHFDGGYRSSGMRPMNGNGYDMGAPRYGNSGDRMSHGDSGPRNDGW